MKPTKTEKILRILQEQAEHTAALFDAMLSSYHISYKKLKKLQYRESDRFKDDWAQLYRERQRLYKMLSRLKSQGLITTESYGSDTVWSLSEKGRKKLEGHLSVLPKVHSPGALIISYDIPERLRKERTRIREVLGSLEFEMIHKSVWLGKNLIPEICLREWKQRKVLAYIHIFEVGKSGTLKKIT